MSTQLTVARPPASQGLVWMQLGWKWFRVAPIPWMGMSAMALLTLTAIGLIPNVGGFVVQVLSPFLVAGFMSASRAAERGEPITFLHLAAGFQSEAKGKLAVMGVLYLAGMLLVDGLMRHIGGESFQQLAQLAETPKNVDPAQAQAILSHVLPAMMVGLLLMAPLVMATWFSPALAMFDGFSTANALWWSLWASAANWRPILLYSLWLGLLGVVAMLIPFGLGLLVFLPWIMASTYAAYRAMFVPVQPTSTFA